MLKVEIPAEIKKSSSVENTILVLCEDVKTCFQLNQVITDTAFTKLFFFSLTFFQYLVDGPHKYLFLTAMKRGIQFKSINEKFKNCGHISDVISETVPNDKPNKKLKTDPADKSTTEQSLETEIDEDSSESLRSSYILTMSQVSETVSENDESGDVVFEPFTQMENMDLTQLCETTKTNTNRTVLIQSFRNIENGVSLYKILQDLKPRFIIMYHSDIAAVRQIEVNRLQNQIYLL